MPSKFYVRLLWASAQQAANKGNGIHGPSAGSRHSDDFEGGVIQDAVKHAPRERAMRSAALQSQGNFTSRRGVLLNHALPQRTAGLQLGVICVAAEFDGMSAIAPIATELLREGNGRKGHKRL